MSLPSLLLRILLSVAMLVSGTGNAVAALQMHLATQAVASHHGHAMDDDADCAAAEQPEPAASAPCHDEAGTRAPEPSHAKNDHCQPDGCASGHCDGFCAQQAPATVPSIWVGNPLRAHADLIGRLRAGHPAPPLPSPQRPPIA